MAKIEKEVVGNFDDILAKLENAILNGSVSSSREEQSSWLDGDFRGEMRVYERYSAFGSNRVSMAVSLAGRAGKYFLSVITSGGSRGVFFKVNTLGEESFLRTVLPVIEEL